MKIVPIELTPEQQEKLDNSTSKRNIEKSMKGLCSKCHEIADYRVIYEQDGYELIERFCSKHGPQR